jgi:DNA-binding MarR family transcriptional regulator
MAELESLMVVSQSGMSRAAQRGVRDGFLEKLPDPADGRAFQLTLTDLGRDRAEQLMIVLVDQLAFRLGTRSATKIVDLARPAQIVSDALVDHTARNPRPKRGQSGSRDV